MCRSLNEGGRRCECNASPAVRAHKRELAAYNRRLARTNRRSIADSAGEYTGSDEVRAAVMKARPRELALVAARLSSYDPALGEAVYGSVSEHMPGIHNMVMQPDRRANVGIDHDLTGDLKPDSFISTGAVDMLNDVEDAYLRSPAAQQKFHASELDNYRDMVDLRRSADDAGVLDKSFDYRTMTKDQATFYMAHTPHEVVAMDEINNSVNRDALNLIANTAFVPVNERETALDETTAALTPSELAEKGMIGEDGIEVRKGVRLMPNPRFQEGDFEEVTPRYIYSVDDGDIALPADLNEPVGARTAGILDLGIEEMHFDRDVAPSGQHSKQERLTSLDSQLGRQNREDIRRGVITAAYTSRVSPDQMRARAAEFGNDVVNMTQITGAEVAYTSRGGTNHILDVPALVRSAHSGGSVYLTGESSSESTSQQLRHSRYATTKTDAGLRRATGVSNVIDPVSGLRSPKTVAKGRRRVGETTFTKNSPRKAKGGYATHKQVMGGLNALAEREYADGIPSAPGSSTAPVSDRVAQAVSLGSGRRTVSDVDVRRVVDMSNTALSQRETKSPVPTNADVAEVTLHRALSDHLYAVNAAATSDDPAKRPATRTYEFYEQVPSATNIQAIAPGRSAQRSRYQVLSSVASDAPAPLNGTRTVKYVVSTNRAADVTDDTAVLGPNTRLRVLRREKQGDVTVVHLVDDDAVLAAQS